jgi:hypothetical protein
MTLIHLIGKGMTLIHLIASTSDGWCTKSFQNPPRLLVDLGSGPPRFAQFLQAGIVLGVPVLCSTFVGDIALFFQFITS